MGGKAIPSNSSAPAARELSRLRSPRWRGARSVAGLCLVGAAIGSLAIGPLSQYASPSIYDLDPSWELSLGAALAQHLQFGTQYLFTYGPLGFLEFPLVYPTTTLTYTAASVNIIIHLLYPAAMLLFADYVRRSTNATLAEGMAILVATGLVALWTGMAADLGTAAEMLSLLAIAECLLRPNSRGVQVLAVGAGSLLAFGALVKVDLLYVAIAELGMLAMVGWVLPRRPLSISALSGVGFLVGYPVLWLATGQDLLALPRFWIGSWQLSSGYSAAMGVGHQWQVLAVVAGLAVAGIIGGPTLGLWRRRAITVQVAVLSLSLPWLFVSWKEGMVRVFGVDSGGALSLLGAILGVGWLVALLSPKLRSPSAIGPITAAWLSAVVMCVVFGPFDYPPAVPFQSSRSPTSTAALDTGPTFVPQRLLSSLRQRTVNALPWDDSMVLDSHLRWDPVPVPQSYAAYTSQLDRLDAAQLASPEGASRLIVSLLDIDGRYLFWDPPALWDTVLSRYRCEVTTGRSAILDRRAPRLGSARTLNQTTAALGEWVTVPPTSLPYEFADVHFTSSLEGKAIGFVLRGSPLVATIRLSNGALAGPLRLIATTAGDGLYLSHYITTARQLCGVLGGAAQSAPSIVAIRFAAADPNQWSAAITITFRGADARQRSK